MSTCKIKNCTGKGLTISWVNKYGERKLKSYFIRGFCGKHLQQLRMGIIKEDGKAIRPLKLIHKKKQPYVAKNPRGKKNRSRLTPQRFHKSREGQKGESTLEDFWAQTLPTGRKVGGFGTI
jgi:hypothetical protein